MSTFNTPEFKQKVKDALHVKDNIVTINFVKKDGTNRAMLCTLVQDLIPEDKRPKPVEPKEGEEQRVTVYSDEALRVFDTEKQEWRSFRWDSITSFESVKA